MWGTRRTPADRGVATNTLEPLRLLEWLAAVALALLITLALAFAAGAIAPVLVLFALALVLAFVLEPVVSLAQRRLRLPRPAGVLAAYVLVAAVLALLALLIAPPLIEQAGQLTRVTTNVIRGLTDPSSPWYAAAERVGLSAAMGQAVTAANAQLQSAGDDIARSVLTVARGMGTALLDLLLLFVIAYYMLTTRVRLGALLPWLSADQKAILAQVEPEVGETLARYLRARLLLSIVVGVLVDLAAFAIGLPYPLMLAAVAAVLELIPFLGPVLGALPAVMVAAVEGPPWRVIAIFTGVPPLVPSRLQSV